MDNPHGVQATLQYLADEAGPAAYIASEGGGEIAPHEGNYAMRSVHVRNGRAGRADFDIEREGFELIAHRSGVRDFYNDDEIASLYETEITALVQGMLGARRVLIFDHTRRSPSPDVRRARKIREPASIVHNDYTDSSGPRRLRDHFAGTPGEADALLEKRFAIVNVWRPIKGPVRNHPLAFCDASSVVPDDLVPVKRVAKDRIGEIQLSLYNPAHRWFYFPAMTTAEVLLFKTFDTARVPRAT